eukprot:1154988-Pelagomonas_calceolata.AAC.3
MHRGQQLGAQNEQKKAFPSRATSRIGAVVRDFCSLRIGELQRGSCKGSHTFALREGRQAKEEESCLGVRRSFSYSVQRAMHVAL